MVIQLLTSHEIPVIPIRQRHPGRRLASAEGRPAVAGQAQTAATAVAGTTLAGHG